MHYLGRNAEGESTCLASTCPAGRLRTYSILLPHSQLLGLVLVCRELGEHKGRGFIGCRAEGLAVGGAPGSGRRR
jgi:hypothetical protein